MADVSTPPGDFETIDTAEIQNYVEQNGVSGISEFLKEKLDTWKKTEVHIGITGDSGTGKSSFVNTIRGLADDDVGAAKVGVVETTVKPTSFDHPQNPNIKIWDLPGIGTETFPDMKTYRKKTQFDKYHTFLIFSCTRFTRNDVLLAREIKKQGKSFFFIRTKIDENYRAEKRKKLFDEGKMLHDIRIDCLKNLAEERDNPISGEDNIFLISNHYPRKWDFERLTRAILDALPRYQRESLTLSLNALTSLSTEILKRKVDIFRGRMWIVAGASAAVAFAPIPGLSFGVDMALISYEISQYLAQIGIPKEGSEIFDILGDTTKKQVVSLYLNFASAAGITSVLAKEASTGVAAEEFFRFIPYIGSAIAGGLSFAGTFAVLRVALNRIEAVALDVLKDAAQRSVDDFDLD
nr:interferon-inducible GTPase 5-like [Pocillopora verrucosa]